MITADPTEKLETIYKNLIDSINGSLPEDLPMNDNKPDKDKIKSNIVRFKTKIKNDAKRTIVDWRLISSCSVIEVKLYCNGCNLHVFLICDCNVVCNYVWVLL